MKRIELRKEIKRVDFNMKGLQEPIPEILDFTRGNILSPYRSDAVDALWSLSELGFQPLAWTPYVRYLFYNKQDKVLIIDTEGDIEVIFQPTEELINECLQSYPKAEVSLGEKYDHRFERGNNE